MSDDIAAMGQTLGPAVLEQVKALYDAEQSALADRLPATALDLAYGPHERHRLDLYAPSATTLAPILIFFHGGGFLKGDKGGSQNWPNANVGRIASQAGFVGIVPNYRLAPNHSWPAGPEDVASVIASWTKANAARHGGDPDRIVLMGTSAGAVHVAGYVKLHGTADIRVAILLSGLYGYTPLDDRSSPASATAPRGIWQAASATPSPSTNQTSFSSCAPWSCRRRSWRRKRGCSPKPPATWARPNSPH